MKRLSVAEQFAVLSAIWNHGEPGYVFLPWIPGHLSREERRRNWNEGPAYDWANENDRRRIIDHLEMHQKDELYFTPAKFLDKSRSENTVEEGRVCFADLDEVDPEIIEQELRPSIAWESSPDRYQAVWLMLGVDVHAYDAGGVNQRLTRYLGADPSGYDAPQVLRVPGRMNYKPEYREENDGAPVPGQLLWSEKGVQYPWTAFDSYLPSAESLGISAVAMSDIEDEEIEAVDRHSVWGRVRLKVSANIRRFMSMKSFQVTDDMDRSDILWQISCDLADAGCSVPEIIAILQPTPWNKFDGRGDELFRLKMGAIRAKEHSLTKTDEEEALEGEGADESVKPSTPLWLGDLAMTSIPRPNWLVHNVWTRGSCGFISGAPKSYKSWIALDLAISVALGKPFLNYPQFDTGKPAKVLYLQEEDNLPLVMHRAEQIVEGKAPERHWHGQLIMSGSEPGRGGQSAPGTRTELVWMPAMRIDTLALHVRAGFRASDPAWQSWLADFVTENEFALVVIDTLGTTVGDIDTDKAAQLNERVLRPLKQISEQGRCAIAVVHHNRKAVDASRSGQQMLGSVALHAWVESALYVQSKEKLTNSPDSEIKVERENKLAEDMKLRVRIPTMYEEGGDATEGRRQVWEPTVHIGWGESDETEQRAQKDVAPPKQKAGQIITDWISRKFGDEWVALELIVSEHGQNKASLIKQLNRAVANDLMSRGPSDTYRVMK